MSKSNGRCAKTGRFTSKGNPGRQLGSVNKTTKLQLALEDAVSPKDVHDVVRSLVNVAKGGDVSAAREVLNRACGKPKDADAPGQFIVLTKYHDERAIGFVDRLNEFADGANVTPDLMIEALRRDAAGKLGKTKRKRDSGTKQQKRIR